MAINQSQLPPALQEAIFRAMQARGQQPTTNMGEAQVPNAPELQAQEGDLTHPADAISQISQQLGLRPQTPATGPKLSQDASGQLHVAVPVDQPLLRLFGVKKNVPINEPNYFQSVQAAQADKFLPSGLAQLPDGTPFVGKTAYDQALQAKTMSGKKASYTKEQLRVLSDPSATAEQIDKAFNGQTPQDVVADRLRLLEQSELQSRHEEGQWNKFTQAVIPAVMRGNTAAGIEARKLYAANHAQSLIDQLKTQPDGADPRQQVELALNVASLLMTNGVVTQNEVENLLPKTLRGKAANWKEFLLNDPAGTESQTFVKRLEDTVARQATTSQDNLKRAIAPVAFGYAHLQKRDPERFNSELMAAANQSFTVDDKGKIIPLPNNPNYEAPQGAGSPQPSPAAPSLDLTNPMGIRNAYKAGKLTRDQAAALLKGMKR